MFVTVLDVNDNPPVFASPTYNFQLDENSPSGSFVGRVMASDPDMGVNAEVSCNDTLVSILHCTYNMIDII